MDAVTPKSQKSPDQHSHVVRPANMEWQPTRFPGCEVKTLLFDRESGLVTALMLTRKVPPPGSRSRPANLSGARLAAATSPGRLRVG
jgi:hypothetical protein